MIETLSALGVGIFIGIVIGYLFANNRAMKEKIEGK